MQLSAKDGQIQSLQASQVDSEARLVERNAELQKYKDLEASNFKQQRLLEQQLEEANEKITNHDNELSSREKKQNESSSELQAQLESLQASFQTKDEECTSMQNGLSAAHSTMSGLQSGKEKAKAEIHSLLRRVQDSERWTRGIKETLEKLGISTADEAFSDTWNRLDALLQAKCLKTTPSANPCGSPEKGPSVNYDISPQARTPRKTGGSPAADGLFQTELIYRTQSIQRGTSSPPGSQRGSQPGIGGGGKNSIPNSQPTANIVPFSSIQNQLSPAHSFCQNEDLGDLASMLMSTPENRCLSGKSTAPEDNLAHPDKQSTQTESMAEQYANLNCDTKRKAVTFETDTHAIGDIRSEVPESPQKDPRASAPGGLGIERASSRLKQRTYGKSQQAASGRESRKRSCSFRDEPSLIEDGASSNIRPGSPRDGSDKRAKAPGPSYPRPERKTRRASEYFETRESPASLASGSSRRSPKNSQHPGKKWAGRGQRRGRRSRGKSPLDWSDIF